MEKEYIMTQEGYDALVEERRYLLTERRDEVRAHLAFARSLGDLSENAEYSAAKDEEAQLNEKIALVEYQINHAKIVQKNTDGTIGVGNFAILYDEEFDEEVEYQLVGTVEADINLNKISYESTMGMAMLGKKKGDMVVVKTKQFVTEYLVKEVR